MAILFIIICAFTIIQRSTFSQSVVGASSNCHKFYHLRRTLDAYGYQEHRIQCGNTAAINSENRHTGRFSMQLYDGSNVLLITGEKLNRTLLHVQKTQINTIPSITFLQDFIGKSKAAFQGTNSSTFTCIDVRQLNINFGGETYRPVKSSNIRDNSDFDYHLDMKCDEIQQFFDLLHKKINTDYEQTAEKLANFQHLALLVNHSRSDNVAGNGRETKNKRQRRASSFILPGTNWCGVGNVSTAEQTYGNNVGLDRCCHEHDRCSHTIPGFSTKYGMYNYRFHTLSHCECDDRFKTCLLALSSEEGDRLGHWFFNVIGMRCFVFRLERVCTRHNWYSKCIAYGTEIRAELHSQIVY